MLEKVRAEAEQSHSAIRKCVSVQLVKNMKRKKITASAPTDFFFFNFIEEMIKFLLLDLVSKACCWWHSWSLLEGCQSSQCISYGLIPRQGRKTEVISTDGENGVVNFHMPPK